MVYYTEDPASDLPQNWEEYHAKYGNKPGQPGWENLSDPERQWIKDNRSPYQTYTAEEEALKKEIWEDIQRGSPADIEGLEALITRGQMTPGIRNYLIKRVSGLLGGGPDYQNVYKAQKAKLDRALRTGERRISETQAARGLLDTSATQARLGALEGEYTGSLADLLLGTRQMEEQARATRFGQGLQLAEFGLGWQEHDIENKQTLEALRNMLYMQDIGLQTGALEYLTAERARENLYQQGEIRPWDPMTGGEIIPGLIEGGIQAYLASQGGG